MYFSHLILYCLGGCVCVCIWSPLSLEFSKFYRISLEEFQKQSSCRGHCSRKPEIREGEYIWRSNLRNVLYVLSHTHTDWNVWHLLTYTSVAHHSGHFVTRIIVCEHLKIRDVKLKSHLHICISAHIRKYICMYAVCMGVCVCVGLCI